MDHCRSAVKLITIRVKFCNGKSDTCKKITIAVFQSGCVIITGANKIEHINVAYEFVCKLLKDNLDAIRRKKLALPVKNEC